MLTLPYMNHRTEIYYKTIRNTTLFGAVSSLHWDSFFVDKNIVPAMVNGPERQGK